jgi:Carbohydrate binding domain/Cellulase (glycosyl hydrolase family 5)/Divergent InlB B-repeat domain
MLTDWSKRFIVAATVVTAVVSGFAAELPGFRVAGRFLYDKCGEKVILRGINKMTVWTDLNGASFPEIAKTGANTVRIVWITTGDIEKFDSAISKCRQNKMIPMVELHDATGEWSKLSTCVNWWIKPEVVSVIQKHEEYLLINIANECGQTVTDADFKAGYTDAVTKMRAAGIHVPLIIDAAKYGQDINILQATGPDLITADPDHNILLSVHMWWPVEWGYSDQVITDEINQSVKMNLPLIVGEFAHSGVGCETKINYKHIISECQNNEIGWLAWEWGPGNSDCTEMDMTTDSKFETLRNWGLEVAVTDPNSIKNTSVIPKFMQTGICEGSQVKRFSVSVVAKGRGSISISPNKSMVDSGQVLTITPVADAGNEFVNWSGSKEGTQNPLTVTVESDLTIAANFTDNGPAVGAELVTNGDFSKGMTGWEFAAFTPAVGTGVVEDGEFIATMTTKGTEGWYGQFKTVTLDISKGKSYIVSFKAKADEPFNLSTNIGLNADPWTTYSGYQKFDLSTEMKTYTYEFTMGEVDDRKARMVFDLGLLSGKIYFDDISVKPIDNGSPVKRMVVSQTAKTMNVRLVGNGVIAVTIPRVAIGVFELISVSGKSIARLNPARYSAGTHELVFKSANVSNGMYLVRFVSDGMHSVSQPLSVIR